MKTVRDIYVDALAMKRQGLPLHEIASRLVDIGHDNSFANIKERGGDNVVELTFPTGEIIHFDGNEWHHIRP